ncbi:HORMA domain-containing protein 1 isoform X3 [Nerophis lumbriciformis]|uniref:HORMA domain-containing protein 1 isoform X3 n=1 Tax=Nerophis lumbriciformis TaxID=546530 RepID=UPI002ADF2EF8|nr:HORMA domain-containing protein 1 isoform X3 [Nerophis lumbriciformis]XP_061838840.1 HORMA domain-containing protein 1 isoform X3 [Nerophis lumbriciformis]XP_061838843.1 HORMA domain-containing protein 1 isoform X3 [Nerophis lumbriciformis]XP_061838844.1 HORMA domain-containing protein 1 isoform X3 [Nerophis lumbriciformis]
MACVQQVRTSQDTQLLPNQVVSELQSIAVIKKLLAIAVSGITYLRGLFPEKAYGNKYVEDQKVMILREEHSCPGACQIVQWMQGCFDAIQMKYLRTVIMSVYTDADNPQKVTEFYQFRIHYNSDGAKMDFESNHNEKLSTISCGSTKKASILLVRKLYTLMQNLGPLPESVYLNMKLAYYDDVTPQDYQPPGFKEADGNTLVFGKEPVRLTMGEVVTPFHTIQLDMATERQRLEPVEETVGGKDKWILRIHDEGVVSQSHVVEDVDAPDNNSNGIELMCHENTYEVTEMKTVSKKTSDMETTTMTTRSGRILKSTTQCALQTNGMLKNRKEAAMKDKLVSKYDIPNSQETPRKKRKFSEPKEHL